MSTNPTISIIVPARQAGLTLRGLLESLRPLMNLTHVEVIIVNDAGENEIIDIAAAYSVRVINGEGRGPASARNIGIKNSSGHLLLFTDADCRVSSSWMESHIRTHEKFGDMLMVGGSIAFDSQSSFWARCDHYCSWYNVDPSQPADTVPNHPSANISVARKTFERVGPFQENLPRAGVHEDTEWQVRLLQLGGRIQFEPQAMIWHTDRSDFNGFIRHNYRWGYNCLLVKSGNSSSRFPWVFQRPRLLISAFIPFAVAHTLYTIHCWVRAGKVEPVLLSPFIFLGRLAYASGMAIGGLHALRNSRANGRGNEH